MSYSFCKQNSSSVVYPTARQSPATTALLVYCTKGYKRLEERNCALCTHQASIHDLTAESRKCIPGRLCFYKLRSWNQGNALGSPGWHRGIGCLPLKRPLGLDCEHLGIIHNRVETRGPSPPGRCELLDSDGTMEETETICLLN